MVPSPDPPVGNPFLAAAAVVGPPDVWTAGAYFDSGSTRQTLIEHYIEPLPVAATPHHHRPPTATP